MLKGRVLLNREEVPVTCESGEIVGPDGKEIGGETVEFLPPCSPSKIVCIGRNYVEHAKELGNPVPERPLLFLKAPSSALPHRGFIVCPPDSKQVECEGEIAVVISRRCKDISPDDDPLSFVAGVTPLNDVTARDIQKLDVQFTRAKSFDTFCPFGPWINDDFDLAALDVETAINGKMVQRAPASDMVFSIPFLIVYISRVMTLLPGDLIATGTPAGVRRLTPGDEVSVKVAGVILSNLVKG